MADILISKFTTQIPRVGATPATPGFAESEGQDPVAPSGTPQVYTPVTIGSPANGLSISGTQVLTIGLASTSTTGALSSTDWNTFNGKLNLTSPITGYTVGANTALADTDTILQAFGKVQGQINARISGTIASGQVAFGTGVNTVGGDSGMRYANTSGNSTLTIQGTGTGQSQIISLSNNGLVSFSILTNNSGNFVTSTTSLLFRARSSGIIEFQTTDSNTLRWFITNGGNLTAANGNTINTTNNGNLIIAPNGTGLVMIGSGTPTNLLDVNGTARIRTISNLGSAATSVLVPSATGVVSLRTLAELASDASLITGSGTNGRVTFWTGTNSQSSDSVFLWDNSVKRLNLTKTASSVTDYHLTLNQVAIGNTLNASGLNYLIIDAVTASTGIALVARPNGTPTGNAYNFQFSKSTATLNNSLLFIGGGSSATGNSANKHIITTSADGGATAQPLILRVAPTNTNWSLVNDHFTIFSTGNVVIQTGSASATDAGFKLDVQGTTRFNGNSIFGTLTSTGTASPQNISLGGSFGTNAIGNVGNTKLFLYQDSTPANSYGFGLSSALMEIRSGSGAAIGFFTNDGVESYRILSNQDLQFVNGADFVFGTTTGTRIGTATNQRLAFYNSTPIVQPSGDILTALSNLGLVASPTITQVDQFAVKTTASADQTLPSGTLTILDYDSTLLNNSTATYTVGTNGRITINTTGIYTITAGVVIEADAVTALESAFLGIFRNGDLVAISSINTTIAAGAQSGLSTSTILSLTATDIIDCRALVNSVGGVANGIARRLGTLLGANATQVNSLSITKNSM